MGYVKIPILKLIPTELELFKKKFCLILNDK